MAWGAVEIKNLKEASGIAASRRNPGVLWTHNDGSGQVVYAIGTNGVQLASFYFTKSVDDTEDIAVGPGPVQGLSYLYLGDIGGSKGTNNTRDSIKIIRTPEPVVDLVWASQPYELEFDSVESFTLSYPDGSYDAESLMVDPISGGLFIVTKQEGQARVYHADLNEATNKASVSMDYVCSLAFNVASAGDISSDGTQIALRREDFAMLWTRKTNETVAAALARRGQIIPVIHPPMEPNGEGIGFFGGWNRVCNDQRGRISGALFFSQSLSSRPKVHPVPLQCVRICRGNTCV